MTSLSFTRMATVTVSIKRNPEPTDGVRGLPVETIASIACTPLDPVEGDLAMLSAIDTPHEVLQTFFETDEDIREGDVIIVTATAKEYKIRAVEDWDYQGLTTRHCLLEELKA